MAKQVGPIYRATFYSDTAFGQLGLGRLNDDGRARGDVAAYHRGNIPDGHSPYAVANEFICSEVGRLLGLPIPPGAITQSEIEPGRPLFSCLDFDWTRETLVDAEPEECAAAMPDICLGITLFDILIANPDRQHWNLKANDHLKPTLLRAYDHADALMGTNGESRLSDQLFAIGFRWWPNSTGEDHCLIEHLVDGRTRQYWYDCISSLPDFQIRNICRAARACGIKKSLALAAEKFLLYRKRNIEKMIETTHRHRFQPAFFQPQSGELI